MYKINFTLWDSKFIIYKTIKKAKHTKINEPKSLKAYLLIAAAIKMLEPVFKKSTWACFESEFTCR